jgi:predicted RNA-binding Zn-ribbon protein involved in translation (DUF1610 family)
MAQALRFVCTHCQHEIKAWSDGNPYYIDENNTKQYAYHPDHERLALCIGNDSPHLCSSCGQIFMIDSRARITACPECNASQFVDIYNLDGHSCPYCKIGKFLTDPNFFCIS